MSPKFFLLLLIFFAVPTFGCFGPSCTQVILSRPCLPPMCIQKCTTVTCIRKILLLPPPPPPQIVIRTIPVQRYCCTPTNFSCCRTTIFGKK